MILIGADELDRLRQKKIEQYNPTLRSMAFIDEDIEKIFDNPNLTPYQKLNLFQAARHRFRSMSKPPEKPKVEPDEGHEVPQPAPIPMAPPPQMPAPAPQLLAAPQLIAPIAQAQAAALHHEPRLNKILTLVPEKSVKDAVALIEMVSEKPEILSINDENQLVYRGKAIVGSNAYDLFHSLYSTSQKFNFHGVKEFVQGLKSINIPSKLISNTQIRSALNPQIGNGRKPPGRPVKVLRLY